MSQAVNEVDTRDGHGVVSTDGVVGEEDRRSHWIYTKVSTPYTLMLSFLVWLMIYAIFYPRGCLEIFFERQRQRQVVTTRRESFQIFFFV